MSRGDLDDAREWDKSDEGLRSKAKASDWFEGTSRDLLFKVEDARAESVDVAKAPAGDSTDAPLKTRPVADLDAPRNDDRADALRDFHLDDSSQSVAREIGSELAQSIAPDRWERAPVQERSAMCEEASDTIATQLGIDVPAPVADSTLTPSELGYSDANSVHYNAELLADRAPQRALETLAHEYRHMWQFEVIAGNAEHPLGDSGREWLREGWRRYDSDANDFENYAWNPLEVDSESFARVVYQAYDSHRR